MALGVKHTGWFDNFYTNDQVNFAQSSVLDRVPSMVTCGGAALPTRDNEWSTDVQNDDNINVVGVQDPLEFGRQSATVNGGFDSAPNGPLGFARSYASLSWNGAGGAESPAYLTFSPTSVNGTLHTFANISKPVGVSKQIFARATIAKFLASDVKYAQATVLIRQVDYSNTVQNATPGCNNGTLGLHYINGQFMNVRSEGAWASCTTTGPIYPGTTFTAVVAGSCEVPSAWEGADVYIYLTSAVQTSAGVLRPIKVDSLQVEVT